MYATQDEMKQTAVRYATSNTEIPIRARYSIGAELEVVQKEVETLKDRIAQLTELLSPVLKQLPPGMNREHSEVPEMAPLANSLYIVGDQVSLCTAMLSQILDHLSLH